MKIKFPQVLKLLLASAIILFGIGLLLKSSPALAQFDQWTNYVPAELRSNTLEGYVQSIINAALVLAGVVAVAYLIIGGYQYITSSGNAETAATAKGTIMNAIIGLVVIFAAYVIIDFVMTRVIRVGGSVTTGTTTTPPTGGSTPSAGDGETVEPPTTPEGGGVDPGDSSGALPPG